MPDSVREVMEDEIQRIVSLADADRDRIREYLRGRQLGQGTPSDEQVLQFVAERQRESPPVLMTDPNGRQVYASPWFVMLGLLNDDNADDLVRKFIRAAMHEEISK